MNHSTLDQRPYRFLACALFTQTTFATLNGARLSSTAKELANVYSISMWFRNDLPVNARPVTAYLFSRGPSGDAEAPGDHLGIGGTYQSNLTGKLMFFNGNASNQVVAGRTAIAPQSWNHAVMIRDGARVRVFLNGDPKPEIDTDVAITTSGSQEIFFGARNDNFAPLQGNLAQLAMFHRALNADEAKRLNSAAQQGVSNKANVDSDCESRC